MEYTIRFFGDEWDHYYKDGKRYYLLIVENDNGSFSKLINANSNRELMAIKELIRSDRMLLIEYLKRKQERYIDNIILDVRQLVNNFFEYLENIGE